MLRRSQHRKTYKSLISSNTMDPRLRLERITPIEFNKLLRSAEGGILIPGRYNITDIAKKASDWNVTAIFQTEGEHTNLITAIRNNTVVSYDPRRSRLLGEQIDRFVPKGPAYITGGLIDRFGGSVAGFVPLSLAEGITNFRNVIRILNNDYELLGVKDIGITQYDGCSCGPLALGVALRGNLSSAAYRNNLNIDKIITDLNLK